MHVGSEGGEIQIRYGNNLCVLKFHSKYNRQISYAHSQLDAQAQ